VTKIKRTILAVCHCVSSVAEKLYVNLVHKTDVISAGGSGIHRPIKHASRKCQGSSVTPGAEYQSKKAKGDVKKKGKPDPYAYLPLSRKVLNRR
jgi:hypothetical protein